jgi:hypothetical protein
MTWNIFLRVSAPPRESFKPEAQATVWVQPCHVLGIVEL